MTPGAVEWVARFRRYMTSERRLSAHTDRSYSRDLTALVRFCDRSGVADWDRLDTQHVRLFAAQSHASGLAPRSIQRRLSAVRSFYEFLLREGRDGATRGAAPASDRRGTGARIRANPAHDVRAPKAARRLPQTLDPDQMRSEEHTSELQSLAYLVCRLLLEKKKVTRPPMVSGIVTVGAKQKVADEIAAHPSLDIR